METNDIVKIFWTGGWDSTFRVLYLVLVEKKTIQPYYLLPVARKSSNEELLAMKKIKEELFKKYPETERLINPTIIKKVIDIADDQEIRQSFLNLQEKNNIGFQYDFMARFAKEAGITGIEVCILSEDFSALDQKQHNTDIYKVFGYALFPLLNMSKLQMGKIASDYNFIDLLNKSWFCSNPINGKPCGSCLPCIIVMEEKMYERMPLISKIRYYTSPKRYLKSFLRTRPKYNQKIKSFFGRVVKSRSK